LCFPVQVLRASGARSRTPQATGDLSPSKPIDCCVSERSIEPRNDTLIDRSLIRPLDYLDERILQDVFGPNVLHA